MINHIGNIRSYALDNIDKCGITPLKQILSPHLFSAIDIKTQRTSTLLIPEITFWLMATVSFSGDSMTGAISTFWHIFERVISTPSLRTN